jgi:hypothetical protein
MLMLNLDPSKLLVIAVVTLIVIGPDKLPHYARQIGQTWRSFSEFRQRMESEVRDSVPGLPSTSDLASYARSPLTLLDRLSADVPPDQEMPSSPDVVGDLPPMAVPEAEQGTSSFDPTLN